ncbi:2OG-Fe(II) oxygenase [Phenylobacterium montanum]|uniref:2OG-Fe(II) oxygenase n=1 Tax=Phenylobacterium montanum TaxID=2823693 RepID=A0A975FYE6_9CAUL|nr:2OG-Fe(II) oxygenase [Caulobacter sp. S6]QUD87217.1 2OG-Fe(II) oxygenase [Caulobacter sp. S6]
MDQLSPARVSGSLLSDSRAVRGGFIDSLKAAQVTEAPYRHWALADMFPADVVAALSQLPFPVPDLEGVSGARELHNNTRCYFDPENNALHPVCGAVAEAFQDPVTVGAIMDATGAAIEDCFLRIEYAQDIDGFWLKPHTDLGVKKLTLLYYLADEPGQDELGTDIYADADTWTKRSAFSPNTAMMFVPSNNTWHGFEPRAIKGVRRSVIINYVTDEWRAREQLAYPTPVRRA